MNIVATGKRQLSSGNVFHWAHVRGSDRGGITGRFESDPPSDVDVAEARKFAANLMPIDGEKVIDEVSQATTDEAIKKLCRHLTHNAENN